MKKALLYEQLDNQKVQCHVCNHHCTILPNHRGICGVRENTAGKLNLLVYGRVISEAIDPIEKKPFFNFLPGSTALSIATVGCNFRCDNCQNWQISQASKSMGYQDLAITGEEIVPDKIVADALANQCASIAYTYTEPTIWLEYALDCMKLAKQNGIKNVWVSNGYMSDETLNLIIPYLDAINVDLKFFDNKNYLKNCGAKLEPILQNLKTLKRANIWLEITTLCIPTLSDSKKMFTDIANFIKQELGAETPWHITAFSPEISYKLNSLPETETSVLESAYAIGKSTGLKYVYTGNVPGLDSENTVCPNCQKLLVQRSGFKIKKYFTNHFCPNCHQKLEIILN